ncbi:MAG: beta-ketoacyl-ACP synthase III [Planctomycetota bacterium]
MSSIVRAGIAGTGHSVPPRVVTNDDLAQIVDTSDEWITQRTGIRERRFVDDGTDCSDLCTAAAQQALEASGLAPTDIDLIVTGSLTQDHLMPSVSTLVQTRLGCTNAGAFDVLSACTGFLTALHTAEAFIGAGRAKNVLAIGGETLSRYLDMSDRTSCILFGDGAGAAVLRPHDEVGRGEVLWTTLGADGEGYEFIHIPTGGAKHPHHHPDYDKENHFIRVRGREVYRFAVTRMTALIKEAAEKFGEENIKLVVPHQVNLRIIEAARERLDWPMERFFVNIHKYGNTSAGSVPIALDEAVRGGNVEKGDIVVLVAFGAGLTWGATAIRW